MPSILCFPTMTKKWIAGDVSWTSPSDLFVIDNIDGSVFFPSSPEVSDLQQYWTFVPDLTMALPSGTVIKGIIARYYNCEELVQSSNAFDFSTSLGFDGAGPLSVTKTTNITLVSGAPQDLSQGGSSDFWGLPFTPVAGNFGNSFALYTQIAFNSPGNASSGIDAVALEFFYGDTPHYINAKYYGAVE